MIDRSDEEMGELVRAWLQRYGLTILVGIIIAIVILSGREWWANRQLESRSTLTEQILAIQHAVENNDGEQASTLYDALDDNSSELKALAALLVSSVDGIDEQKAVAYLQIATKSNDPLVAQTAHWQLAQHQISSGDYDAANQSLQILKGSIYDSQIALLHAVIAQQQGHNQQALDAYEQALAQHSENNDFILAQMAAIQGALVVTANEEK